MDFFQAQDDALRRSKRLVFYYMVAVVCIVIAVYLAVTIGFVAYDAWTRPEVSTTSYLDRGVPIWDPARLLVTGGAVVLLVGLGSIFRTLSLRGGGSKVAETLGGQRIDRSTRDHKRKQLLNVVEEMAIASGVPVPEVYLLPREGSINAFAAGWGTDDAVVAVSAGALEHLSRDELQGVVAHEFSHILHGDCRLNIKLMGVIFGIMMLTLFGRLLGSLFRGGIYAGGGRRRRSSGGGGGRGGGAAVLAVILVVVLITIIGYIGTFFARLIQAAISRQREFLADAAAVQFTRNPEGIAGALKKVGGHVEKAVLQHPKAGEAAHMFFADGMKRSFSSALATHPPLEERIKQIDPQWDGKYDFTKPKPRLAPETEASSPEPGRPAGREMIEGMAILGAIGTLSRDNLAAAQKITGSIPEALDERLREPEGAMGTILALIMADNKADDEKQWKALGETVDAGDLEALKQLYGQVSKLPREARLGMMELATTTLVEAPEFDLDAFLFLIGKLIDVDKKLSLYECCMRRILRERLNRKRGTASEKAAVHYMQLKPEVARAAGVLLSLVARESTSGDDGTAMRLMQKAVKEQYLLNQKVQYLGIADCGMKDLDGALDTLRASAFAIRAQCLRAVVTCIRADGKLAPSEAELLRMISLSLDCPVPPMG